jgi:hypothetical protein
MRKVKWGFIIFAWLWIILATIAIGLMVVSATKAQENTVTSCYTHTDQGGVFTFSNIPDSWLGELGWYFIGDDVKLEDHTLIVTGLQFDNDYSYAIVGNGDSKQNFTATSEITPPCVITPPPAQDTAKPLVVINNDMPTAPPPPMSTGRTCVIQYPKIILVCS